MLASALLRRRTAVVTGVAVAALTGAAVVPLTAEPATAALPSQCVGTVDIVCTFTGPSATYNLTIPNAVTSISIHAVGQRGLPSGTAPGGDPAYVDASYPVSDGQAVSVQLRNDGGAGGTPAAGRGGGSAVVMVGANPVVIAAGGGGAGEGNPAAPSSAGGAAGQAGHSGSPDPTAFGYDSAAGGQPGSATAGGAGGTGAEVTSTCIFTAPHFGPSGAAGTATGGGRGGVPSGSPSTYGGGGGGGGRYGGGGGGSGGVIAGCGSMTAGGGGGGSSYAAAGATSTGISVSESSVVRISFTLKKRASYSPTSLDLGATEVGKTGAPQQATVTNTGSLPLDMGTATITGADAASFVTSDDTCSGATVAVGATCHVGVRLTPTATGEFAATLSIPDGSPSSPHLVALSGVGTPPADLKILSTGSVYVGKDHLVTRTVKASGVTATYKVGILNDDSVSRSFRVGLTPAATTAQVWTSGFRGLELPKDAAGNYITPPVAPGKVLALVLRVTPSGPGQVIEPVGVHLLSDLDAPIESVSTETNTAAPVAGTTSYELFAKQGSDPYIGGPLSGQTATAPALNVGQTATFSLKLKNDGGAASFIGLRMTDVDGCSGSFTPTVKVGTKNVTAAALDGTYQTPLLAPSKFTTVKVTVKRAAAGCPYKNLKVQSLDTAGNVVRTSYLLTNAAYNAALD
jgi:hypothetical protein